MAKRHSEKNMRKGAQPAAEVSRVLNLKGMITPLTFLKIAKAFREIQNGEIMDIICSDPDTKMNFSEILRASSYELLHIKCKKDLYFIRLRKSGGQGAI